MDKEDVMKIVDQLRIISLVLSAIAGILIGK